MISLTVGLVLLTCLLAGQALLVSPRRVPPPGGRPARASTVSVVVPARDEEATLPRLLASLQRQSTPPLETLVVDDGSDDGTRALVDEADGMTLVVGTAPPPGWTGKAWACEQGARRAGGDALVFLDADTELAPDALAAVGDLLDAHGGLVSVQPFHDVERPYEQLSAYFNLVSVLASGAFSRDGSRAPMAFGPVLTTAVDDYQRAGRHAVVRDAVLDDVQLAVAYRRSGSSVLCFLGGERVKMRMYPQGLRQLVEGWSKNMASGAAATDRYSSVSAAAWLASHWAVAVGVVLLALSGLTPAGRHTVSAPLGHPAVWLAAYAGIAVQLRWMLRQVGSFRAWTWALFPLPLLAFTLIFARSVLLTAVRGKVTWRGRSIPVQLARRSGSR